MGENLALSQVRERFGVQESLWGGGCGGEGGPEGDGEQPQNWGKVERNECKWLHALEFGPSPGFRGERKELWPRGLCNALAVTRTGKGGGCWE